MKFYEYIMARTIFKIANNFDKSRKKADLNKILDVEVKFDKGYWHYDVKREDYIYVEPKKDEHFVTIEENVHGRTCKILLSKKPISIKSEKFDYSWEAELHCIHFADTYRDSGYEVTVKREAPVVVADYDMCCPFCLNSSPFNHWARNSYIQELMTPPEKLLSATNLTIHEGTINLSDIKTEKLWCPICNNGIEDREWIITKGNEWKVSLLAQANLPKQISPYMQQKDTPIELSSSKNMTQHKIENPFEIVTDTKFGGLVIRVVEKADNKNRLIYKPKWKLVNSVISSDFETDTDFPTSYYVKTDFDWVAKRDKYKFPIIYVPIDDLIYNSDRNELVEILDHARAQFHAGEPLEVIKIVPGMEIIKNAHLALLASELGLSHVPVIVGGDDVEKKVIEEKFKEIVGIYQI